MLLGNEGEWPQKVEIVCVCGGGGGGGGLPL